MAEILSTSVSERGTYATQPGPLRLQIDAALESASRVTVEGEILGVIVPATNRLSGAGIAAEVYSALRGSSYDTVVLVAPSHTGSFSRMNICSVDRYWSPLGEVDVNDVVRNELCDEDDDIYLDDRGHYHAEGIDVQLPFLQTVLHDFDIVPVVMGDESPEFCRELGTAIGEVMYNRRTLVVATCSILQADADGMKRFEDAFSTRDVSTLMSLLNGGVLEVEGKGPLLVALIAAMHRRASNARVLSWQAPRHPEPGFFGAVISR